MEDEKRKSDQEEEEQRRRKEDPMTWGLNRDDPGSFNEYMKV